MQLLYVVSELEKKINESKENKSFGHYNTCAANSN